MPAYQDTEEMSHLKTPPTDHHTFVDDESFDNIKETAPRPLYQRQTLLQRWAIPVAIHLTLITFYTVIALAILRLNQSSDAHGPRLIYSPARAALRFEIQEFNVTSRYGGLYYGRPSPELDLAWHNLLQYANIRFSAAEIYSIASDRKVKTFGLEGYFGTITVFHELHCLKRIHQSLYPKYYHPNLSLSAQSENLGHDNHCIDILRQGVMCRGDISPITMPWDVSVPDRLGKSSSRHECANWESINEWAKGRALGDESLTPDY